MTACMSVCASQSETFQLCISWAGVWATIIVHWSSVNLNFERSLTCTLRASSEFCEVSSSICSRSSATVLRSAGAGEWWAESGSPWQVASSWAGAPLECLESSFSRGKVQKQQNKMIVIFLMWHDGHSSMLPVRVWKVYVHIDCIPGKSNISSKSSESLASIPWPPLSSSSSLSLSASESSRRCFSWDNYIVIPRRKP